MLWSAGVPVKLWDIYILTLLLYSTGQRAVALWLESANNGARDLHHPLYMRRNWGGNRTRKIALNSSLNIASMCALSYYCFEATPRMMCRHNPSASQVHEVAERWWKMKMEKVEKEKRRKSLTGGYEIRPACSQTCDRGFGERNELGRGVSEEGRRD